MATHKVVLLNNEPLKIDDEVVLLSGESQNRPVFILKDSKYEVTNDVVSKVNSVMEKELDDYYYKFLVEPNQITMDNPILKIISIFTPVYYLKSFTLAGSDKPSMALRDRETNQYENVSRRWGRDKIKFFADEIVKYSELMPLVTSLVNPSLKFNTQNPALLLKSGSETIMRLFHVSAKGIVNPFLWLPYLSETKLFRVAFNGEEAQTITSIDDPHVFRAVTNRNSTEINVATCYDILQLCGIKKGVDMKTTALVKLIGALALNRLGATTENPELPTKATVYIVIDPEKNGGLGDVTGVYFSRDEFKLQSGETCTESSLMQLFLTRTLGESAIKYLVDFENARLI